MYHCPELPNRKNGISLIFNFTKVLWRLSTRSSTRKTQVWLQIVSQWDYLETTGAAEPWGEVLVSISCHCGFSCCIWIKVGDQLQWAPDDKLGPQHQEAELKTWGQSTPNLPDVAFVGKPLLFFLSLLPCRTTARSRWKWKARKNSWKTRISAQSDMANYVISCTAICIGNTMNRWTLMDFMDLECAPSLAKRQSQEQSWPLRSSLHMSTPLSCRVFLVKLLPDMQDVSHVSWIAAFSKRPQEVCFSQTWYAPLPTSALFLHRGTVS